MSENDVEMNDGRPKIKENDGLQLFASLYSLSTCLLFCILSHLLKNTRYCVNFKNILHVFLEHFIFEVIVVIFFLYLRLNNYYRKQTKESDRKHGRQLGQLDSTRLVPNLEEGLYLY